MDKIGELAYKNKKSREWVEKNLDYIKKHPYDILQPKDKLFNKVWGGKIKKREEKLNRNKNDAEEEYREKKNFKKDKVYHKKFFI